MRWTVSRVARLAGVSVRTLHHYDDLGLLRPSGRSDAGYRLYDEGDLVRLQQVLLYRTLGFALEDIARILDDPGFDLRTALVAQREQLALEVTRTRALIGTIDAALDRIERGEDIMTEQDAETMFEGFDPQQYEAEAERRWGGTDAYRESQLRTARYTKQDWDTIKAEAAAIYTALADALAVGTPPEDANVIALAERHRQHIDRWFYPCSSALHVGLGDLYVDDPRFTANIDRTRPGLAAYLRAAIRANAARTGGA